MQITKIQLAKLLCYVKSASNDHNKSPRIHIQMEKKKKKNNNNKNTLNMAICSHVMQNTI